MNPHPRHVAQRLLAAFVTAGVVAATFLVLVAPAQAQAPASSRCSVQSRALSSARQHLTVARTARRTAKKARRAARTRYEAKPSRRHHRTLRTTRVTARRTYVARRAARGAYDTARRSYLACLSARPAVTPPATTPPGVTGSATVTVENPRIAYFGNRFAIADLTWSNVPLGDYEYFLRINGAPRYEGHMTVVDVLPPPVFIDPGEPLPEDFFVRYVVNGQTYAGSYIDGGGCDFTPGADIGVELWTAKDTNGPAGVRLVSVTVDNPCN